MPRASHSGGYSSGTAADHVALAAHLALTADATGYVPETTAGHPKTHSPPHSRTRYTPTGDYWTVGCPAKRSWSPAARRAEDWRSRWRNRRRSGACPDLPGSTPSAPGPTSPRPTPPTTRADRMTRYSAAPPCRTWLASTSTVPTPDPGCIPRLRGLLGIPTAAASCGSRRGTARRRPGTSTPSVSRRLRRHAQSLGADDPHIPVVPLPPHGRENSDRASREMDR